MNTKVTTANEDTLNLTEKVLRHFTLKSLCENAIVDKEDMSIGELIDVVIAYPSGKLIFAVISRGGFLGFGKKMYMVPWENIELDTKKHQFILSITNEQLKTAPSFTDGNWPNLRSEAWTKRVMKFYANDLTEN